MILWGSLAMLALAAVAWWATRKRERATGATESADLVSTPAAHRNATADKWDALGAEWRAHRARSLEREAEMERAKYTANLPVSRVVGAGDFRGYTPPPVVIHQGGGSSDLLTGTMVGQALARPDAPREREVVRVAPAPPPGGHTGPQ